MFKTAPITRQIAIIAGVFLASPSFAATQTADVSHPQPAKTGILLAKNSKTSNNKKLRQKHLVGEARNKRGKTSINFDEASIDGRRRLPAGVAISKNRPDHDYDLINLRLRWHPEMIQSTTSLETGQGR